MKNKTKLLVFLGLFLAHLTFGQDEFYYIFDYEKEPLVTISGEYLVHFTHGTTTPYTGGIELNTNVYITTDTTDINTYASDYYITPAYMSSQGGKLYEINQIVLQFKKSVNSVTKNNIISTYELQHIKTTSVYELYSTENALQKSKQIYQTGHLEYCTPNFIIQAENLHIPNDEYFGKQFYLHNTGQVINDGLSGTSDADIDATEAWDITKGDSSIIIAVVDDGITSDHPDLPNSRQIRLDSSNFGGLGSIGGDGTDVNNPKPYLYYENHGNAVAGIVAATQDNGIGISGIAPLCKIMPIRKPQTNATFSDFADAIEFANVNNPNIITCSWALSSPTPALETAISNAINNGIVVIFAAGNNANHIASNMGSVRYPANINVNDLIAVGASDRNDSLANYSATGIEVDLVAPSHSAYSHQITGEAQNIWTIDIPDTLGYNKWPFPGSFPLPILGDILPTTGSNPLAYTGRMGGSSSSAPQVAGVAALMLSVNPCLSPKQEGFSHKKTVSRKNY